MSTNSCSRLLEKYIFLKKQKFDVKQLKNNKCLFNVKQLKMNVFIFDARWLKINKL